MNGICETWKASERRIGMDKVSGRKKFLIGIESFEEIRKECQPVSNYMQSRC